MSRIVAHHNHQNNNNNNNIQSSPRSFGPLVLVSSKKGKKGVEDEEKDYDPIIADMLSYPYPIKKKKNNNEDETSSSSEEEEDFNDEGNMVGTSKEKTKTKSKHKKKDRVDNSMLRIDETAELLLGSLKRNRQLGLQLSEEQKKLLKDIGKYLIYEEEDGVRKSKARMDFKELKEGEEDDMY